MTKQLVKEKIDQLPDTKIDDVADYVDYILCKEKYCYTYWRYCKNHQRFIRHFNKMNPYIWNLFI